MQAIRRQRGEVPAAEQGRAQPSADASAPPTRRRLWRPLRTPPGFYSGLPRVIPIPPELQFELAFSSSQVGYRALQASAASLYSGTIPPTITGGEDATLAVTAGDRYAQWCLALCLRYAPDDTSRRNAVQALSQLPFFPRGDAPVHLGPQWVVSAFVESGAASNYHHAFAANPAIRDILHGTVMQSGLHDAALDAALAPRPPRPG